MSATTPFLLEGPEGSPRTPLIPASSPGSDIVDLALEATHRDAADAREELASARMQVIDLRERMNLILGLLDSERRMHALTKRDKAAVEGKLHAARADVSRYLALHETSALDAARLRNDLDLERSNGRAFRMAQVRTEVALTEALEALEAFRIPPGPSLLGRLAQRFRGVAEQ